MNILNRLRYLLRAHGRYAVFTRRYRNLLQTVRNHRSRTFLEVGVFRGDRALEMIQTASLWSDIRDVTYYGFDLFEDLTAEDLEQELSLVPPARDIVARRLEKTGARIELFKGYSRDTLPRFVADHGDDDPAIDLIFLDGGHSVETIAADWQNLEPLIGPETVALLDDYYPEDLPELRKVGCNRLIDDLDPAIWHVEILDPEDRYKKDWGELAIRMVRVRRAAA